MNEILLTLGHNSSAILIEDGKIAAGYETERLSGIKSDSHFPAEVLKLYPNPNQVYVSHWDPHGKLENMKAKHWWPSVFNPEHVTSTNQDFTHHDAHAWSALWFAGDAFPRENTVILVVDGFGNCGEHISVYDVTEHGLPVLTQRHFGYASSLGLMYQYATGFLGMRMNEDEYKLLGYEVHVHEIAGLDHFDLDEYALVMADQMWRDINERRVASWDDPLINIGALVDVQKMWADRWHALLKHFHIDDHTSYEARVVVGYTAQLILEYCVTTIARATGAKNFLLAGGVFYNVKLNKKIVDLAEGLVCINPLSGDQGAAIGLYYATHPNFKFDGNICWGHRRLYHEKDIPNLDTYSNEADLIEDAKRHIQDFGFVNIVRGSMEFGPRALGNTSTIAIPDMQAVHDINEANGRNTIMPMAPICTEQAYKRYFKNTEKVHRSEGYMITALEYTQYGGEKYRGASHEYIENGRKFYTGRPQVVSPEDSLMSSILASFGGVLINTSFNAHGRPIPCTMQQVIENHMFQYEREEMFHTLVLVNS